MLDRFLQTAYCIVGARAMDPIRDELHDDLLATLATSKELPPENDEALATAFLDRLQRRLDRNDVPVSGGQGSHLLLRFVEALTGCGAAVLGLGALAYAYDALMAGGPNILAGGYSQQHGVIAFNHVMSVLGPFMAVTALICV